MRTWVGKNFKYIDYNQGRPQADWTKSGLMLSGAPRVAKKYIINRKEKINKRKGRKKKEVKRNFF